jgi:FtsP/CotA-like multicopper oxidase with cupredoxin domain
MQASEPFVIWDPHYVPLLNASNDRAWTLVGSKKGVRAGCDKGRGRLLALPGLRHGLLRMPHTLTTFPHPLPHPAAARAYIITGDFLMDQNDRDDSMFLVNSDLAPNKTATAGQTVRYRVLCATTEALCMIKIVDPQGNLLPFYVFASDGITQSKSVKRDLIMLAGGYRNDILVQYPEEGRYEFVQEGLSHLQFFGFGPPNVTLAYVDVTPAPTDFPGPINLEGELLPKLEAVAPYQGWGGKDKNVKSDEINVWRKWDFALFGNMSQAPFPQFMINKLPFNLKRIVV